MMMMLRRQAAGLGLPIWTDRERMEQRWDLCLSQLILIRANLITVGWRRNEKKQSRPMFLISSNHSTSLSLSLSSIHSIFFQDPRILTPLKNKYGDDFKEQTLTVCSGLDMVNISLCHFVFPSKEITQVSFIHSFTSSYLCIHHSSIWDRVSQI